MKPCKGSDSGFTLVELMISVSILLILVSMLTVIFRATQESFVKASSLQKVFNTSRSIIQRMHDEVSAAFFGPLGKTGLLGIDGEGILIKAGAKGDSVFFFVPLSEQEDGDICEIGYWLREDGNLMRHFQENTDFDFTTTGVDDALGLIVNDLEIQYFNGTGYQANWDARGGGAEEGRAPKAVKISFTVSDDKELIKRLFETTVHITSGRRY